MSGDYDERAERLRRHNKRIAAIQSRKAGLMNNSKWAKIFRLIREHAGIDTARAKMLDDERLYAMELAIYADTLAEQDHAHLRGYTSDGIAGPLKLSEIEYMVVALPPETDCRQLAAAIRQSGRYEIEMQADALTVYGWK